MLYIHEIVEDCAWEINPQFKDVSFSCFDLQNGENLKVDCHHTCLVDHYQCSEFDKAVIL